MRKLSALLLAGVLMTSVALADDKSDKSKDDDKDNGQREAKVLRDAQQVLDSAVKAPDKGIPKELLERAECIGVFPDVSKGAFIVGGEFGRGVFTCRTSNGTMGAPAFFTIGGPSVGWQLGGKEADLILLIMNKNGVKYLLEDKFTLGAEAAVAAGPVGRTAEAATDAQLHAQILSWSRSRGLFVGASLEGSVVSPSKSGIKAVYGKELSAKNILVENQVSVPKQAEPFISTANQHSKRG